MSHLVSPIVMFSLIDHHSIQTPNIRCCKQGWFGYTHLGINGNNLVLTKSFSDQKNPKKNLCLFLRIHKGKIFDQAKNENSSNFFCFTYFFFSDDKQNEDTILKIYCFDVACVTGTWDPQEKGETFMEVTKVHYLFISSKLFAEGTDKGKLPCWL